MERKKNDTESTNLFWVATASVTWRRESRYTLRRKRERFGCMTCTKRDVPCAVQSAAASRAQATQLEQAALLTVLTVRTRGACGFPHGAYAIGSAPPGAILA